MNKEIRYSGYTAQPSDYDAPDGQLSLAINLINEDGAITPILGPRHLFKMPLNTVYDGTDTPAPQPDDCFIHTLSDGHKHLLVRYGDMLLYTPFDPSEDSALKVPDSLADWKECHINGTIGSNARYTALGNILVIATDSRLIRLQFVDGDYVDVGEMPMPAVSFYLTNKLAEYPEDGMPMIVRWQGAPLYEPEGPGYVVYDEDEATDYENALIGSFNSLVAQESNKGRFTQPFLAQAALRLYDGSLYPVSEPQLCLPASAYSPFINAHIQESTPAELVGRAQANSCKLTVRIGKIDDAWKDKIIALEIFVSRPIYTYSQAGKIKFRIRKTPAQPSLYIDGLVISYCERADRGKLKDGEYFNLPYRTEKEIIDEIKTTAQLYKVFSITRDELLENIGSATAAADFDVDIKEGVLLSLPARPSLPVLSHTTYCPIAGGFPFVYNARLHIANFRQKPPRGFTSGSMAYVFLRNADGRRIVIHARCNILFSDKGPLYAYFPHPDAYQIICIKDDLAWRLPLVTHDFLDGALFMADSFSQAIPSVPFSSLRDECTPTQDNDTLKPSAIYVSQVNNPFIFPASLALNVGSAPVLALSSAAKALSQGQFGQFPLYAFTSQGVWALSLSSDGSYSARQPITRDVCSNPRAVTQLDSAVIFPTAHGIMLLSGSQTQCITDAINAKDPFDVLQLPGMAKLHSMLGHEADTCLPAAPFLEFISECGMLYDYVHQRVIVYNPKYTYAYVFSLKSKQWGMTYSTIAAGINSYPEALAVDRNGALLNFSSLEGEETTGLLLTRPLKLDTPDLLKTLHTVIQRGHFRKGHVQSVLYASRDLVNWHLIWSSRDHFLRGFHGTPYKYFRIALLLRLAPGESLSGASLHFTPRLNNHPR